jgi:hypothetical protein
MKKNYKLLTASIIAVAFGTMNAQCPTPTSVTASPNTICAGATTSLNATAVAAAINWYTVAVGGIPIGSSPSASNFTITPNNTGTYYAESFIVGAVNYTYTGAMQTFTVPAGVTQLTIDVKGAQGGGNATVIGGLGGRVQSVLSVTPGQVYNIFVGGQGDPTGTAGYNGGGTGIGGTLATPGSGGGGATDIRFGGITLANRILVAGGGGGATDNGGFANGGAGGGLIGGNGSPGTNVWSCTGTVVPTGGSQLAGGLGGTSTSCAWNGFNGSLGLGGNSYNNYRSSGGGGGYYGGGGAHNGMSGGGGSSYAIPTASFVAHTQGFQTGNGSVTITYPSCFSATRIAVTVSVNPIPTITVNSGSICAGNSFTINPSGASTYTIQGGNAIVSPTTSTSYTIVGASTAGCVSQTFASSSVSVSTSPIPTITVNSGAICIGNSFTMAPSGASTYTFSNGSAVSTPTANTSYSVTGTSSLGCVSSNTAVSSVSVNALPTVSVNSGAVCAGSTFTMVPTGANTYTFSSGNAVVTPTANTSYSVIGTSSLGCVSSNAAVSSVSVNALPIVSVNSGAVCAGSIFTMVPSGANTYTFSSGNAVVTPTANTSYSVTGTSSAGCVSSNTAVSSVSVNALPTVSVNSGAVCAGSTFTMVPTGANTYTFSSGNAVVTPTANSSYSVTGTNSLGCVSSNAAISNVLVNAAPAVTAVSNTTLICSGSSATLTASGAISYTWNTTATTTAVVISPSVTTSYTVTGSGANGCKNTITITQSVSACAGINANQLSNTIISVYPNPSNGEFTISTDSDMNLSIINNLGQVVKEISINSSNNYNASVSNLANGIYFVVGKNNDQLISQKIIVAN